MASHRSAWESLRYRGSGWWLDAMLPHSPVLLVAAAFALPIAWFAVGYTLADDPDAFLATPDCTGQLWFFPLHVIALRLTGSLWATRLDPALAGLAMPEGSQRTIRRGTLGTWASVGALVACLFFIVRDAWFGFAPDPASGLIPFDDPEMWDMAALGRSVHVAMLALWCVEWLLFGYLLWLQIWILVAWTQQLRKLDYRDRLADVLVGDGYRHAFELFGKTTTIALVFALGNLGFIAYTGELIPREVVEIDGAGDFLREMSDLLSTTLLFVLALVAAFVFVRVLRGALTRAVNARFAEAGELALRELARPLEATGDVGTDVEALRARANAQAGLLRAVVFQREVDTIGHRTMAAIKLRKVLGL
jgi:hypothetical protein